MIYDLTMYSGERDILEIRLETLKDCIDKFIIVESNYSHSLIKKPLFFKEQESYFDKFKDKIIYIIKDSCHENAFYNDWEARLNLFNAIPNPNPNDIIHHSDNDEISNPEILFELIRNLKEPINLCGDYFMFCVDLWGRESNDAILMKYDWCREPFYKYRDARNSDFFKRINKSSWHFSGVGTPENIIRKMRYFAHASECPKDVLDVGWVKQCIIEKRDSISRNSKINGLKQIEINYPNLPKYIVENQEKFQHLFYSNYV